VLLLGPNYNAAADDDDDDDDGDGDTSTTGPCTRDVYLPLDALRKPPIPLQCLAPPLTRNIDSNTSYFKLRQVRHCPR